MKRALLLTFLLFAIGAALICPALLPLPALAQESPPRGETAVAISPAEPTVETLYGALILATNVREPAPLPPELRAHAKQLSAFGYNQFRLLGSNQKAVPTGTEDWLVPSRQFFLRVDTKKPVPNGYSINLQLFQESRLLVEANVRLRREHPLFISGPQVGAGQLIIMLKVL